MMKTFPILIALVFGASIAAAEESTFEGILGRSTVKRVVNQVVISMAERKDEKYPTTIVEPLLFEEVVVLAGKTTLTIPIERPVAEKRLKDGVSVFFNDFREFAAKRGIKFQLLILRRSQLPDFLGAVKTEKGCGKIPCPIPPCCGDCDDCKGKMPR